MYLDVSVVTWFAICLINNLAWSCLPLLVGLVGCWLASWTESRSMRGSLRSTNYTCSMLMVSLNLCVLALNYTLYRDSACYGVGQH